MTVLRQRTRRIAFRISEEDYEKLRNACIARGARSVSDLARTAVDQFIGRDNGENTVTEEMAVLARTVRHLKWKVEQLAQRFGEQRQANDQPREH